MSKIGFVLKGYPRISETFIAQEIYLLEQRGFDIEIYSMRGPRESLRHPVHGKIAAKVTYIPEYIFPNLSNVVLANIKTAKKFSNYPKVFFESLLACFRRRSTKPLKRFLQAGWLINERSLGINSDVKHLHSHFIHTPTELTFYVSKLIGITYSISAHAKDIYTSTTEEIRERVQRSQFLMTCTEFNYHKIREIVGKDYEGKVHKVYHGVNLSSFKRKIFEGSLPKKRILTVARLVDKKGYDDVFKAMCILNKKSIHLHYDIYGDGELRADVKKWIHEMGLDSQVTLHGAVTQPQVLAAYNEGGVFVLASRETEDGDRDGIPNSMAEAMSMGLPVVATKVSGIPELVENGVTGLLASQRSPEEFARALERIFHEDGLANRLGESAHKKVSEIFDADRCIDVCEKLLKPFA